MRCGDHGAKYLVHAFGSVWPVTPRCKFWRDVYRLRRAGRHLVTSYRRVCFFLKRDMTFADVHVGDVQLYAVPFDLNRPASPTSFFGAYREPAMKDQFAPLFKADHITRFALLWLRFCLGVFQFQTGSRSGFGTGSKENRKLYLFSSRLGTARAADIARAEKSPATRIPRTGFPSPALSPM